MPSTSSKLTPISPEHTPFLPWAELHVLFGTNSVNDLERKLGMSRGTLAKVNLSTNVDPDKTGRGISPEKHEQFLKNLATKFITGAQMQTWLEKYWPATVLKENQEALQTYYMLAERTYKLSFVGPIPRYYLDREQELAIVELLKLSDPNHVVWLTGLGGIGKTAIAQHLLWHQWVKLNSEFDDFYWLALDKNSYEDNLRQFGTQLETPEYSLAAIERKIQNITRTKRILFILDGLDEVGEFEKWRKLLGASSKMLVTSRYDLSVLDLHSDRALQQIKVEGFTNAQCVQYLGSKDILVEKIFQFTEGLPLALFLLKALHLEQHLSWAEIWASLERKPLDVLDHPSSLKRRYSSLKACFDLTWSVLEKAYPEAAQYFQATGVFQTRLIHKALLDQVANVSDPVLSNKWLLILKAYSSVETVLIENKQFVRFHALLHPYIQEKLSTLEKTTLSRLHKNVISAFVTGLYAEYAEQGFPHLAKFHFEDMRYVIKELMTARTWQEGAELSGMVLTWMASDGSGAQAKKFIETLPTKMGKHENYTFWLNNAKGDVALALKDIIQARKYYQSVNSHVKVVSILEPGSAFHKAQALLGIARCDLYEKKLDAALKALEQHPQVWMINHPKRHFLLYEKFLLLGEIYDERRDYPDAIKCFGFAMTIPYTISNSIAQIEVLNKMASCYRNAENYPMAIKFYESLMAFQELSAFQKAGLGLELIGCYLESGQIARVQALFDEIEEILARYQEEAQAQDAFARFWKYKTGFYARTSKFEQALECAEKSLTFWKNVPQSEPEQEEMSGYIASFKQKIAPKQQDEPQ